MLKMGTLRFKEVNLSNALETVRGQDLDVSLSDSRTHTDFPEILCLGGATLQYYPWKLRWSLT